MVARTAEYTHTQLVHIAERWLQRQGCGIVFRDAFRALPSNGEQPDAIGWRHGVSILIECKTSRADFLADRSKPFRQKPEKGMGDWRFFLCPKGLITPDELPPKWGLLSVSGTRLTAVHGMPARARWKTRKPFVGNKLCEVQVLYAALRRFAVRGHLDQIYLPIGVSKPIPDEEGV